MDSIARKKSKSLDPESVIRVINEELISKSAAKQKIVVDKLSLVPSIILSFKKIRKIDNLQGFTKLTVLKLDNNNIEKIENLTSLVTLELLDLSFNQISEIPKEGGLETLVNLKELSLFANRISDVSALTPLVSLQILSLGDNLIDDIEKVKPLRALKNLQALTLIGNPIAKEQDYASSVLAYLSYPITTNSSSSSSAGDLADKAGAGGLASSATVGAQVSNLLRTDQTLAIRGIGSISGAGPVGAGAAAGSGAMGAGASSTILLEAANDTSILGAGGVSTGMINISTPLDVCEVAAKRGGLISVKGGTAIRTLAYLDYHLVNVEAVIRARESYGEDLAKLEQDDANAELQAEAKAAIEAQRDLAQSANITGLDTFFQEMLDNDQEYQTKLKHVRVIQSCLDEYKQECNQTLEEFKQYMLGQLEIRKKEEEELHNALDLIEEAAQEKSQTLLSTFNKLRKDITRQIDSEWAENVGANAGMLDPIVDPEKLKTLTDANESLQRDLMDAEEERVEQAENILEQYSTRLKDLFSTAKERIHQDFGNLLRLEVREADVMTQNALREAEKAAAPAVQGTPATAGAAAGGAGGAGGMALDGTQPMTAEERGVLTDKPSLQQSLKNSTEFRQAKIHEKEDEIVDREKKTRSDLENKARDEEHMKNRTRLIEIWHYYDSVCQFIQQLQAEDSH